MSFTTSKSRNDAIRRRLEIIEHNCFGENRHGLGLWADNCLGKRVQEIQSKMIAIGWENTFLLDLESCFSLFSRLTPRDNLEVVEASSRRIEEMYGDFVEVARLAESDESGIEQDIVSANPFLEREAALEKLLVERRAIRNELVEFLSAYSLWIDAISEEMVKKIEQE